jgi:hypothetical protein
LTAPKKFPAEAAGYSGCLANSRCFYEGSRKERLCATETLCIRDQEVRIGHERTNASPWSPEKDEQAEVVAESA